MSPGRRAEDSARTRRAVRHRGEVTPADRRRSDGADHRVVDAIQGLRSSAEMGAAEHPVPRNIGRAHGNTFNAVSVAPALRSTA
jgi:hypothetical protein